jgi:hypothetical protein
LAAAERRQAQQGERAGGGGQGRASAPSTAAGSEPPGQLAAAATSATSGLAAGDDAPGEAGGVEGSLAAVVGGAWADVFAAQPSLLLASGSSPSLGGSGSLERALVAALADETDPAALAARLRAAPAPSPAASAPAPGPSAADVAAWVRAARDSDATRAVRGVVGSSGLVAALFAVKVRTARDLALWAKRPALLRAALAKRQHASNAPVDLPDDATVLGWAAAAQAAMAARPWIEKWATRV